MPRISRELGHNLIQFVRKVEISANIWHPTATSALEFHRQMDSKRLRKKNPEYDCKLHLHADDVDSTVKVSFSNGSVWETSTKDLKCEDLRGEMFIRAEEIDDEMERAEADDVSGPYDPNDVDEDDVPGRIFKHVHSFAADGDKDDDDDKKQQTKAKGGDAKKAASAAVPKKK